MDILTLELFDVTVSQALLKVQSALERHPALPLRILVEADDMVRSNLERYLERQGRPATSKAVGGHWQLDVAEGRKPSGMPTPALVTTLPEATADKAPKPVLLLRSAFVPGDRALGRQLLLGVLATLETGTPWVLLAHDALDMLEDPSAMECLENLQHRGIPIRLSEASLVYFGRSRTPFPTMNDTQWQSKLGRGELTVL